MQGLPFDPAEIPLDVLHKLRAGQPSRTQLLQSEEIDLLVDAGASNGQWGESVRADGYTGRIVSFEPLADAYYFLARRAASDPNWTARRVALGDVEAETIINVSRNSWSSSLLPMEPQHRASAPDSVYVAHETVPVVTLDSIRADFSDPTDVIYLKLDVQGYELQVLRGAAETLPQVRVVEAELSLVPLYEGQALLPEIVEYLDDRRFDLVALAEAFVHPGSGRLLQLDGIFVSREHISPSRDSETNESRRT